MRKQITVLRDTYKNSHGQYPRGFGLWWFQFEKNGIDFMQFSFNGSFAKARFAAVQAAKENGASVVRVLP